MENVRLLNHCVLGENVWLLNHCVTVIAVEFSYSVVYGKMQEVRHSLRMSQLAPSPRMLQPAPPEVVAVGPGRSWSRSKQEYVSGGPRGMSALLGETSKSGEGERGDQRRSLKAREIQHMYMYSTVDIA